MRDFNANNTREARLINSLTIKGTKSKLIAAYCEHFGFKRNSFYRRIRTLPLSPEEREFFENYFKNKVAGGEKLLREID